MDRIKFQFMFGFKTEQNDNGIFADNTLEKVVLTLDQLMNGEYDSSIPSQLSLIAKRQYTGMTDQDAKGVFDGEIVKVFPKEFVTSGFIGEVKITPDGVFVFGKVDDGKMSNDWGLLSSYTFQSIGNRFENPDLAIIDDLLEKARR